MALYRSKPASAIDAFRWTGDNYTDVRRWAGGGEGLIWNTGGDGVLRLDLVTGDDEPVPCPVGHWVIREPANPNRFYPCDPLIFENRWEPA